MKNITKTLVLLAAIFFCGTSTFAQTEFQSRNPGYWTFGLNLGKSFQTGDVCYTTDGWGGGATLAKNLYYKPGAPLIFDIRGRLLLAQQYGFDDKRNYGIINNERLNGDIGNLDYTLEGGGPGFVFHNHKTTVGELALEGVFTFNRLLEQRKLNLSIYGGVGIDWFNTKIDQRNENGLYDVQYLALDTTASSRGLQSELKTDILDLNFETQAPGFEGTSGELRFMPNLGIELGWQMTPRFSIGVGHRTTFSGIDYLDGSQYENNNQLSTGNDWYHYTSASLKWILDPDKKKLYPPAVDIYDPGKNPHTTKNPNARVRAKITNITNADQATLSVNGVSVPFEYSAGKLYGYFELDEGSNEVVVSASNSAGSDSESTIIIFKGRNITPSGVDPTPPPPSPPSGKKPSADFTRPGSNTTVNNNQYNVEARIKHVTNKSDIRFSVNGAYRSNFNFDSSTGKFTAPITLKSGSNDLKIEVSNTFGNDNDRVTINFEEAVANGLPPKVTITSASQPTTNPMNPGNCRTTIKANIDNIDNKNDIVFRVNGNKITNFSFSNGKFQTSLDLDGGTTNFIIAASNDWGSDDASRSLTCNSTTGGNNSSGNTGANPPNVTIVSPSGNTSSTSNSSTLIKATITNVTNANNIDFRLNGQRITNFSFKAGTLTKTVSLVTGNNIVSVKATNNDGNDQATVSINRTGSTGGTTGGGTSQKPVVTINSPNNNSTTTTASTVVKAQIKFINDKNDVQIKVNGSTTNSVTYNKITRTATATVNLNPGSNTIIVKGTNSAGSDQETLKVTYQAAAKPNVDITSPSNNSTTSKGNALVKATIKNVANKNQVSFKVNGKSVNFNLNGNNLSGTATLKPGSNTIVVSATTSAGSDSETVRVTYNTVQKPTVQFIKPSRSGTISSKNTYDVKVKLTGVSSKNDVKFRLNGANVSAFNYNNKTGEVTARVVLKDGSNTIWVEGKNSAGAKNAQTSVVYKAAVSTASLKPEIEINSVSQPTTNPMNPGIPTSTIIATISNVTSKSAITFKFNGAKVTNFSFNKLTKKFQATVNLVEGSNTVFIEASTKAGKDSVTRTINN